MEGRLLLPFLATGDSRPATTLQPVPEPSDRRTILWHTPAQAPLLRRLASSAGLSVFAVGCPDSTLASGLAKEWGGWGEEVQPLTDLRAALATAQRGTLLLVADPGTFGAPAAQTADRTTTRMDVEELDAAEERGVKVVCLEPLPAALTQLAEAGVKVGDAPAHTSHAPGDWAFLAPLSRFNRPVQELRELLPTLGPIRTLSIHALGTPAHGSLGARLFDAADLALTLLGQPESVHAVFTTPAIARGTHAAPPPADHLRALDGDLTATLRYAGNRAATLTVSNRAACHRLSISLLAGDATLTIDDDRLTVQHNDDPPPPDAAKPARPSDNGHGDLFVEALAVQITRYLDSGVGLAGQVDFAATLALAQAALLSARTGEPEAPATMLKLAGF